MSQQLSLTAQSAAAACRTHDLECRLARIADGGPAAINDRLAHLDSEWSAGRVAKAVLSIVILLGTVLTLTVNWWWVVLPAVAGLFLLQYLFTSRTWLVRVMQEAGFRTKSDIEHEKFALRTLRGDFRDLPTVHDIEEKDDISRLEGEGGIVVEIEAHKVDAMEAAREVVQATNPH
jgi:hypothetical protein